MGGACASFKQSTLSMVSSVSIRLVLLEGVQLTAANH